MKKFETLCELLPADVNWGDPITPQIIEEIVLAEREAAASQLEALAFPNFRHAAKTIRMRSNAELRGATDEPKQ